MKLIEIISLAAVAVFATSCEKTENQNQEPEVNLSETVAGTYTGYSTAEFQYSPTPMLSQNQTLTVTAEDGGTVSVSYTSDTWGTFTISAATVGSGSDGRSEDYSSSRQSSCRAAAQRFLHRNFDNVGHGNGHGSDGGCPGVACR